MDKSFVIADGILFRYFGSGDAVIPEGVHTILGGAFERSRVTSVTLPEGLKYIDRNAFRSCVKLTKICIPDSVEYIGDSAFAYCPLTEVSLPADGITVDRTAFDFGVKIIHRPGGIKRLWDDFDIRFGVLFGYNGTGHHITVPDFVIEIGESAFANRKDLYSITLPENLKVIGSKAFSFCENLEKIVIPGSVTKIEEEAFYGCSYLTDVILSEGLKTIGNYAFSHCEYIFDIDIPASVTSIGTEAFTGCDLTEVTLPSRDIDVAKNAFDKGVKITYADGEDVEEEEFDEDEDEEDEDFLDEEDSSLSVGEADAKFFKFIRTMPEVEFDEMMNLPSSDAASMPNTKMMINAVRKMSDENFDVVIRTVEDDNLSREDIMELIASLSADVDYHDSVNREMVDYIRSMTDEEFAATSEAMDEEDVEFLELIRSVPDDEVPDLLERLSDSDGEEDDYDDEDSDDDEDEDDFDDEYEDFDIGENSTDAEMVDYIRSITDEEFADLIESFSEDQKSFAMIIRMMPDDEVPDFLRKMSESHNPDGDDDIVY